MINRINLATSGKDCFVVGETGGTTCESNNSNALAILVRDNTEN